jgi:hypothetical protein
MLTDKFSSVANSHVNIMLLHFALTVLQTYRNQLPEEPGMRALRRPKPEHIYDPQVEIDNLLQHRDAVPSDVTRNRNIPAPGHATGSRYRLRSPLAKPQKPAPGGVPHPSISSVSYCPESLRRTCDQDIPMASTPVNTNNIAHSITVVSSSAKKPQ